MILTQNVSKQTQSPKGHPLFRFRSPRGRSSFSARRPVFVWRPQFVTGSCPGFAVLRRICESLSGLEIRTDKWHIKNGASEEIMDRSAQTQAHTTAPLYNREPREQISVVCAPPCSLYVTPSLLGVRTPPCWNSSPV